MAITHWLALITAVVACSSGGVWFLLLRSAPPLARSWWRLALTALLQLPGFMFVDMMHADGDMKRRFAQEAPVLGISGIALAVHFAAWSASLQMTSLSHSLLFVCTTPLLIVGFRTLRWLIMRSFSSSSYLPPTLLEVIGSMIGFVASIMLATEAAMTTTSTGSTNTTYVPASLPGDVMATLGAAAMGVYLHVGDHVRQWMPIWMYVFPVTLFAALLTAMLSILVSGGGGPDSAIFLSWMVFGISLGSAVTAGILGHTLANYAVPHVGSLVVSIFLLWEPLIGSMMGFVCGLEPLPGPMTFGAGIPLILGAVLVICGKRGSPSQVEFERLTIGGESAGGGGESEMAIGVEDSSCKIDEVSTLSLEKDDVEEITVV